MLALCKEIVIFLIIAKMLEGFQAGNKYAKFVKLIISLIVVLKLITPIFSLFDSQFDLTKIATEIEQELVFEEGQEKVAEYTELVETIEIPETKVEVEEIKWE